MTHVKWEKACGSNQVNEEAPPVNRILGALLSRRASMKTGRFEGLAVFYSDSLLLTCEARPPATIRPGFVHAR